MGRLVWEGDGELTVQAVDDAMAMLEGMLWLDHKGWAVLEVGYDVLLAAHDGLTAERRRPSPRAAHLVVEHGSADGWRLVWQPLSVEAGEGKGSRNKTGMSEP